MQKGRAKLKINAIRQTTFGYDKNLNSKLEKTLKIDPTPMNKSISALNSFCNEQEDMIRKMEKKNVPLRDILLAMNVIIPAKVALTQHIEANFPNLNYQDTEVEHYRKDKTGPKDVENDFNWRLIMASEIESASIMEEQSPQTLEEIGDMAIGDLLNGLGVQVHKFYMDGNGNLIPPEQIEGEQDGEEDEFDEEGPINPANLFNFMSPATSKNQPSAIIQEFIPNDDSPKGFVSIGGMEELKEELREKIVEPVLEPEKAELDRKEYGIRIPRGILLYGPPGCGKTFVTEALALETGLPLYKLQISKVGSMYINQTSKNIEAAFDIAAKKAEETKKPVLMFIDEIDGLTKGRDDISSSEDLKQMQTLLQLIETARSRNIIMIGATNKYDLMDEAIKSRLNAQIYVGMPDVETRKQVLIKNLEQHTKGQELIKDDEKLSLIAKKLDKFPHRAICKISEEAAGYAKKDNRSEIKVEHYERAIANNLNLKVDEEKYKPKVHRTLGFNNS